MNISDHIEINPGIMLGKPVIRGTRVPVELILRKLGEGASEKDMLEAYPRLTVQDLHAAVSYAAGIIGHDELIWLHPDPDHDISRKNEVSC